MAALQERKVRIVGITAGDPSGVGPEVSIKALRELARPDIIPVLIGRAEALRQIYPELANYIILGSDFDPADLKPGLLYCADTGGEYPVPEPGRGNEYTGRESLDYIDYAVELWKSGRIDAVATAPVSKELINRSGTPFVGHTEYFADMIGETNPYMMMYSPRYRVILSTTHIPVSEVEKSLSVDSILNVIRMADRALLPIDGARPRIAVCGLDPHCGDGGAISGFDSAVTREAIRCAVREGIAAEGPYAADTLFIPGRWSSYGTVVAQYHDQGLIPFKMLAFDTGVNVTLGLSMVRTSADHGTAFDIAGKGLADFRSMRESILLAASLSADYDRSTRQTRP